jgi:hypothetical protein
LTTFETQLNISLHPKTKYNIKLVFLSIHREGERICPKLF